MTFQVLSQILLVYKVGKIVKKISFRPIQVLTVLKIIIYEKSPSSPHFLLTSFFADVAEKAKSLKIAFISPQLHVKKSMKLNRKWERIFCNDSFFSLYFTNFTFCSICRIFMLCSLVKVKSNPVTAIQKNISGKLKSIWIWAIR